MCLCVTPQRIASVFPSTQGDAKVVLAKVINIRDNDEREDLKLSAKMYAGGLERRIPTLREGGMKSDAPAAPAPTKSDGKPSVPKDKEDAEKADAPEPIPAPNGRGTGKRTEQKQPEAAPAKPESKPEPKVEVKLAGDRDRQRGKAREVPVDADNRREHVTDGHVVKLADRDSAKATVKAGDGRRPEEDVPKKPAPAPKVRLLLQRTTEHARLLSRFLRLFVVLAAGNCDSQGTLVVTQPKVAEDSESRSPSADL
jgi:hypothetical protein